MAEMEHVYVTEAEKPQKERIFAKSRDVSEDYRARGFGLENTVL
jgi:hypothetical protein